MEPQTKTCQNCKHDFTIESEDFSFYEKIKVPPPTFCPECRLVRRMAWRNERALYRRPDSRTGETIFSMYSAESPVHVYEFSDWMSDVWSATDYAKDYDFSRSFFEQFFDLMKDVPLPSRAILRTTESDYANNVTGVKNCYLVFSSVEDQDCAYSVGLTDSKNVYDSYYAGNSENVYEGFQNYNCYNAIFSSHCEGSVDIAFCNDCSGVSDCFGCVGLRKKKYCVFNKQLSKEEYEKFMSEAQLGSFEALARHVSQANELKKTFPVRFSHNIKSNDVTGDYIRNSSDVKESFQVTNGEHVKYSTQLFSGSTKDAYDYLRFANNAEMVYETVVCGNEISNIRFCFNCYPSCSDLQYSIQCENSSNLFACVGLRNKQYCILNKQYSKEEYEALVPKIIAHMNDMPYVDAKGRKYTYGEFFPPELSPFAYNETIAQEYFPLTKEEAIEKGYRWRDQDTKDYKITTKPDDLQDHIKDVPDSITKEVIGCAHGGSCTHQCTSAFKIIPQELQFYRQMNLPLPRLCPNCRHHERLKQRNPLKLWHRQCECEGQMSKKKGDNQYQNTATHTHGAPPAGGACPTEFETSYAPDRPEIVYCEQCYNAEVA